MRGGARGTGRGKGHLVVHVCGEEVGQRQTNTGTNQKVRGNNTGKRKIKWTYCDMGQGNNKLDGENKRNVKQPPVRPTRNVNCVMGRQIVHTNVHLSADGGKANNDGENEQGWGTEKG